MKPHKFFISAVLAAVAALASGCSDWLDYTPEDQQTADRQFATEEGFHNAVNGCYNLLVTNSLYGYNLTYGPLDVMGNCYSIPSSRQSMIEFANATYTGSYASSTLNAIWSNAYRLLLNVNTVLDALETHPDVLRPKDALLIKGEMLGLRAFVHLDLVRLFGPSIARSGAMEGLTVPYMDSSEIMRRERLTLSDIITGKIIPDLAEAQSLLKDTDPVLTDGVLNTTVDGVSNWDRYRQLRMNYYAVTLTKARAFLWIADLDNAKAEAVKIAGDAGVETTFPWVEPGKLLANRVNPDRVFSTECLFGYHSSSMGDIYKYNFAGTLDPSSQLYTPKGYLSKLFPEISDYRYQSQFEATSSQVTDMDFVKYKSFTTSTTNPAFHAGFFGLMRKSEAYLIAAECMAKNSDISGALTMLNILREARGIQPLEGTTPSAQLLKEIKLEYCRDMRGEGQIFFLHKRNWQAFYSNNEFDGSGTNEWWDSPNAATRFTVPIPSSEQY